MKFILVGYGFLGSSLLNYLSRKNEVLIINRTPIDAEIKNKTFNVINNFSKNYISKFFNQEDIVIFTANPPDSIKNLSNIEKNQFYKRFRNLVDVSIERGISQFIYFSSTKIYKNNQSIDEYSKIKINSQYLELKFYCEEYIFNKSKNTEVDFKIVRISNVFGLTKNYNKNFDKLLIPSMIKSSFYDQTITLNRPYFEKDFITINKFNLFIDRIIKDKINNSFKIYNLASFKSKKIVDVAKKIKKLMKKHFKVNIIIKLKSNVKNKINIRSKTFSAKFKYCELDFEKNLLRLINFYKNKIENEK